MEDRNEELRKIEFEILKILKFDISFPSSYDLLHEYIFSTL